MGSDSNKKVLVVGKNEVAKNRIFGMPTTRLTRLQRVSFTALIKIAYDMLKEDREKFTFEFPTQKFLKMIGISERRKDSHLFTKVFIEDGWETESEDYSLERTLNNLVNKSINMRYKDKDGEVYKSESVALISYFKLTKDKITFRFDEWVREKIYVTNNLYLMQLPVIASFKSGYTVALFEQLEQRRDFKKWEINLEHLRLILGVEEKKYKRFYDFKNRAIETARQEIEEKTNYLINVEYVKSGRKITKVIFRWSIQKNTFEEFKEYIRKKFVNKDLIEIPSKDKTIHLISVDDKGRLYNKRNPDKFYNKEEADSVWRYMYSNQDLLIKNKIDNDTAEHIEDWSQYYGKDILYDDELYKHILRITPKGNKLKVLLENNTTIIMDVDEFFNSLTFIPKM